MTRKIDSRELVLRVFPPMVLKADANIETHEVHVYRLGLATGKAIPACTRGESLLNRGIGYYQYVAHSWIVENAPICEVCYQRLVSEGLAQKK